MPLEIILGAILGGIHGAGKRELIPAYGWNASERYEGMDAFPWGKVLLFATMLGGLIGFDLTWYQALATFGAIKGGQYFSEAVISLFR